MLFSAISRVRVGIWRTIPQQLQRIFSGKNPSFEKVEYIFIAFEERELLFSRGFLEISRARVIISRALRRSVEGVGALFSAGFFHLSCVDAAGEMNVAETVSWKVVAKILTNLVAMAGNREKSSVFCCSLLICYYL